MAKKWSKKGEKIEEKWRVKWRVKGGKSGEKGRINAILSQKVCKFKKIYICK
jgi:hypothetical protein